MGIHTTPTAAEPQMLAMFRALPDKARHQFLQLAIDEMELDGSAERSADLFLADTAWEAMDGDEDRALDLYPKGCTSGEVWLRHKLECASDLLYYERAIAGRFAMLAPVLRVSPTSVIA